MNRFPLLAVALAAALLTGCASVDAPGSRIAERAQVLTPATDLQVTVGTPAREWWRALGDPQLDALVAEAMARNHDVQAATAAVQAARSLVDAAQRDALPQGRLEGQAQAVRPSTAEVDPYGQGLPRPPSARMATIGQGLAWEIDLFGRVGTAEAVAARRADSSAADLHAATALLQGEVVRHYAGLRLQQQALQLLKQEAQLLGDRARQLRARAEAGLADRREAWAAEAEQQRAQAETAAAEAEAHVHLTALAVLSGRSPTARDTWRDQLLQPAALPAVPGDAALQQPTDLLARRPDVARADAQLRAAMGETVLAERAHLPRLSLNLVAGLNAPFGRLGDAGALRYAAGPALSWDWLDFGRLKARATAAKAGEVAALHAFEQAVLKALQDSEVALRQWVAANRGLGAAQQAERVAAQAAAYAQSRASAGLEPPTMALDAAAQHLRAQRSRLVGQADALLAFGQTQLALGAWQPDAKNVARSS